MILSGLSDEAADDLESQIRATCEIGWSYIDLRKVDGKFSGNCRWRPVMGWEERMSGNGAAKAIHAMVEVERIALPNSEASPTQNQRPHMCARGKG